MKLSDLKTGMTVETRNRDLLKVVKDVDTLKCGHQDILLAREKGGFLTGSCYNEDMMCCNDRTNDEDWDIMKVYDKCSDGFLLDFDTTKLLWERDETKEFTIDEICKLLGYNVKVVGDK